MDRSAADLRIFVSHADLEGNIGLFAPSSKRSRIADGDNEVGLPGNDPIAGLEQRGGYPDAVDRRARGATEIGQLPSGSVVGKLKVNRGKLGIRNHEIRLLRSTDGDGVPGSKHRFAAVGVIGNDFDDRPCEATRGRTADMKFRHAFGDTAGIRGRRRIVRLRPADPFGLTKHFAHRHGRCRWLRWRQWCGSRWWGNRWWRLPRRVGGEFGLVLVD